MRKLNLKKILSLAVCSLMITPMISTAANAEVIKQNPRKYVALGDSIGVGLSAEPGKGYVDLLSNHLMSIDKNVQKSNLSVNGHTTTDLLGVILANQATIANSEIVTVSIGGNNFLKPTIAAVNTALAPEYSITTPNLGLILSQRPDLIARINASLKSPQYLAAIKAGGDKFAADFPQIIQGIKMLSPNAKIYVNNLYNPINAQDPFLNELFVMYEGIFKQVNDQILAGSATGAYTVIDAYTLLKAPGAVNFSFNNADPHPTTLGHGLLGKAIIEKVDFKPSLDTNNDNKIDELDLANVATKYNVKKSDSNWDIKYDFNADGIIDILDLVTISNKIGI